MALTVLYRAAARFDISVAARDHEERRSGLGTVFVTEIARLEAHIAEAPGLYQAIDGEIRRAVM